MSRRHAGTVKLGFEQATRTLPIAAIAPLHLVSDAVKATPKYGQIVASIREIGVVEPPVVVADRREPGRFLLLDGHLRIEALVECAGEGYQQHWCRQRHFDGDISVTSAQNVAKGDHDVVKLLASRALLHFRSSGTQLQLRCDQVR